jgi:glycosyltransferase involved in cell wall biosynthesis
MTTSFPLPGEYDGTAMLAIQVFRALKRRGVEVVLAHLKARRPWGRATVGEFEGVPYHTLPPAHWVGGLAAIRRGFPFDLVHTEHYGAATRAYAACALNRWPLVYSVHSLLGDEVERDRLGRGLKFRAYRLLERLVCRRAAGVVVLGEGVKRVMAEEKGVDPGRVAVIYPGVDLDDYRRPGPPATIDGVEPHHKVIMYVGNLVHPNQGVPVLVEALPKVFDAVPEARAVLVGGPSEAGEAYRARLGRHGEKLVVLTGQTPERIVGLCRRADVLVHPRLACRENYSVQTKMAVYLASGRPVVATDFGDYARLLGETGAGRLTAVAPGPLAGGIVEVLTDPALAARLASATGRVAEEYFGMDRNVDRYLALYRRVLSGPAGGDPGPVSARAPGAGRVSVPNFSK